MMPNLEGTKKSEAVLPHQVPRESTARDVLFKLAMYR